MKTALSILMLCLLSVSCYLLPNKGVAGTLQYPMTVTDLAGRHVTLNHRPSRVFLGQPRFFYAIMSLTPRPTDQLAGWNYPLSRIDPEIAPVLNKAWPALAHLPALSPAPSPHISGEGLIAMKPDLVVLPLNQESAIEGSTLAKVMQSMQIPWIYVDFDQYPLVDPAKSISLLGRVLGHEKRATRMTQIITHQQHLIATRVALMKHHPSVLINITPGIKTQCCRTNIRTGMDNIVTAAGGKNIAHNIPSDKATLLSNEWILGHPTDVVINTARMNVAQRGIRLGPGASESDIQQKLVDLTHDMSGWTTLRAVKDKRFYVIWHGLHQGPYAVVDLMQVAKWLYPSTFSDISPMKTFRALLGPAAPVLGAGIYWGSLGSPHESDHSINQ
ncbi:hypothetical protein LMG33818_002433 [Halomonadaceae bacterium LMG 33818]|uniref:ABC transporter substrate-binding protein n=1 Tax=Cernens ardua TaxID=3402176 RepID=UPI003EDCADEC